MDVTFEHLQVVQQQTSVSVELNQYPEGETTDLICVKVVVHFVDIVGILRIVDSLFKLSFQKCTCRY
jgi:hypothetical protein